MLDKSLIIAYSTPNYAPLTKIFKDSLEAVGVEAKNIKHKLDVPNPVLLEKTGFQSYLWFHCVSEKIKHLLNVLQTEKTSQEYFIFSDCDIHFITQNKICWKELENHINTIDPHRDIYFMRDYYIEDVNTGFYIIRNNMNSIEKTITFFTAVYQIMKETLHRHQSDIITIRDIIPHGDQTIINLIKNHINYGYIPNEYVVFGTTIFNKEKALFHHAVMTNDITDKIEQINLINRELQSQEPTAPLT
jgi:hypothetical protein